MSWNISVSTLVCGAALVVFDGDPTQPDLAAFWRLVGARGVTHLGTSPPFLSECRRQGLVPAEVTDLSRLRVVCCGGSPLSAETFVWVYEAVGSDLMLASVSGGTDVCASFVGGSPLLPVRAGEITCRFLGTKVEAFDDEGHSVVGQQAELVITEPMPSMPVGFWGDTDGSRYRAAYFDRFPNVWCHGDWITITELGTSMITGRSDATLNRGGIRMGSQEFYTAMEEIPDVTDSLVVHLEDPEGGLGELLVFVSLPAEESLNEQLRDAIRDTLRRRLSPRHVPNEIIQVRVIPRTITGKRLEVPVKRILSGVPLAPATKGSLADGEALEPFVALAARRARTTS
jgi:acetoacetyl-CoA synthetase